MNCLSTLFAALCCIRALCGRVGRGFICFSIPFRYKLSHIQAGRFSLIHILNPPDTFAGTPLIDCAELLVGLEIQLLSRVALFWNDGTLSKQWRFSMVVGTLTCLSRSRSLWKICSGFLSRVQVLDQIEPYTLLIDKLRQDQIESVRWPFPLLQCAAHSNHASLLHSHRFPGLEVVWQAGEWPQSALAWLGLGYGCRSFSVLVHCCRGCFR